MQTIQFKNALMSEDDYLASEETSEVKREYINGLVIEMVGCSRNHSVIAGNLYATLYPFTKRKNCDLYISDMKLKTDTNTTLTYRYPDLFVYCGEKNNNSAQDSASLIVEVLSPSTKEIDLTTKLNEYRWALRKNRGEYLIISSMEKTAYLYRWCKINRWEFRQVGSWEDSGIIELNTIAASLDMDRIYDDIVFDNQ
ncbi:Uma2 family endonuclease [Endozoicomonas sp. ONNA1]|uniref:Uma2 family endonuclease n=1 Tax=Endozoicomonas sp. ONNA1 TaxID=2828740 RepID=UPI0021483EB3|nr:Uma2 family endonuclease [Endozoicomonas sp. ONNA1]